MLATGLRIGEALAVSWWLRGRGRLDRLAAHAVGIVGSQQSTPYGERAAAELGRGLSRGGWTVVTLGRFGVDGAALRGADQLDAPTVVLPLGPAARRARRARP